MKDGRKKLAWRVTKISLIAFLPITMSLIPFSENILHLFGPDYGMGGLTLEILLFSMMPLTVVGGIRILVYAYGNYRQVLAIGIGTSIPRILLYFILVPLYGSEGAGLSFTIGSIIGFIVSLIIAKKIGMKLFWKELFMILVIPLVLSFSFSYFEINFVVGIIISVLLSYILYAKLKILTKEDVDDFILILPNNLARPFSKTVCYIAKKLNLFTDTD